MERELICSSGGESAEGKTERDITLILATAHVPVDGTAGRGFQQRSTQTPIMSEFAAEAKAETTEEVRPALRSARLERSLRVRHGGVVVAVSGAG